MGVGVGFGIARKKYRGSTHPPLTFVLLLVLASSVAMAEAPAAKDEPTGAAYWAKMTEPHQPGQWFLPISLVHFQGYTEQVSWFVERDPSIDVEHRASYGAGIGLGYQWPSGLSLSMQLLHVTEKIDARWVDPAYGAGALMYDSKRSRGGAILTLSVPLGGR